jgi:hypothetical protein
VLEQFGLKTMSLSEADQHRGDGMERGLEGHGRMVCEANGRVKGHRSSQGLSLLQAGWIT